MNFWLNWKTNSAGIVSMLLAFVDIVTALVHYNTPNWAPDFLAIVLGFGLLFAKDSNNHSTLMQVETATNQDRQKTIDNINKEK